MTILVTPRYTRQEVENAWWSARSVIDIEVLTDHYHWVRDAVLYHGAVLRSMSPRLQNDVRLRLEACQTDSDAVLWVLSDLAQDYTKTIWWRLQTIAAVADTWLGRVLPPGQSIDEVMEDEKDEAVLQYYSMLIQKLVEKHDSSEEGIGIIEQITRARIATRAEQIQAKLLSPDGIIFKKIIDPEANSRGEYNKKRKLVEEGLIAEYHTHWQH